MTKGARRLTCELRYHGEYGVETMVLLEGELYALRPGCWRWGDLDRRPAQSAIVLLGRYLLDAERCAA